MISQEPHQRISNIVSDPPIAHDMSSPRIVSTDSPDLVGAFCLWLSKSEDSAAQREALNRRWLSCKWDVQELEGQFELIQ